MSVYVDSATNGLGRMIMCHMIADTPEELREMAVKLGLNPRWFQASASAPHYDIAKGKRMLAISNGAVVLDRRQFVDKLREIKQTWPRADGRWIS